MFKNMTCHCNLCGIYVEAPNPSLALCSFCNVKFNNMNSEERRNLVLYGSDEPVSKESQRIVIIEDKEWLHISDNKI